MSEFVKIEMLFHSKVLEVYTDAWQCLNAINDEDDLEVRAVAGQGFFRCA